MSQFRGAVAQNLRPMEQLQNYLLVFSLFALRSFLTSWSTSHKELSKVLQNEVVVWKIFYTTEMLRQKNAIVEGAI